MHCFHTMHLFCVTSSLVRSYFILGCPQGNPSLLIVKHVKELGIHYMLFSIQKVGQPDACPISRRLMLSNVSLWCSWCNEAEVLGGIPRVPVILALRLQTVTLFWCCTSSVWGWRGRLNKGLWSIQGDTSGTGTYSTFLSVRMCVRSFFQPLPARAEFYPPHLMSYRSCLRSWNLSHAPLDSSS